MSIISSLAVLSLAASSASAISLSSSCISVLTPYLLSTDNSGVDQCFATSALVKFLPLAQDSSNSSVTSQVDAYLQAVCPAPICSNDTVQATATSLEGGCGEVFASAGLSNETVNAYIPFLPQIKSVACVQTSNSSEAFNSTVRWTMGASGNTNLTSTTNSTSNSSSYCLSSTLATIEYITNQTLSFSVISSLLTGSRTLSSFLNTTVLQNNTELLCNDCTKGLYTQLISLSNSTSFMNATSSNITSSVTEFVTKICGASFINATVPTTITNGSNPEAVPSPSAVTAATGSASSLFSLSPVAAVLAAAGVVGAMLV